MSSYVLRNHDRVRLNHDLTPSDSDIVLAKLHGVGRALHKLSIIGDDHVLSADAGVKPIVVEDLSQLVYYGVVAEKLARRRWRSLPRHHHVVMGQVFRALEDLFEDLDLVVDRVLAEREVGILGAIPIHQVVDALRPRAPWTVRDGAGIGRAPAGQADDRRGREADQLGHHDRASGELAGSRAMGRGCPGHKGASQRYLRSTVEAAKRPQDAAAAAICGVWRSSVVAVPPAHVESPPFP